MLHPWSFEAIHKVSKMAKNLKINACLGVAQATFVLYTKFIEKFLLKNPTSHASFDLTCPTNQ